MESREAQIVLQCSCGDPLDTVIVEAPATITICASVAAELEPSDLHPNNIYRSPLDGSRMLKSFRLNHQYEVLDNHLDHELLEIDYKTKDYESAIFVYCPNCSGELSLEVFDAWIDRAQGDTDR